eukprot:CAMPEP_0177673412 /NCGR_PEP_ID=MMETSP0447-20121125/25928_1 /TAXON_ID=0 /ORGANISM="Stygamoeba regulata, Strain BSH-02190019" /LENGTH=76 /DNA_ID=CAMNT_0019181279 /DNA_START=500 /DNA_END=730 /DNA_ORIENTATION=-
MTAGMRTTAGGGCDGEACGTSEGGADVAASCWCASVRGGVGGAIAVDGVAGVRVSDAAADVDAAYMLFVKKPLLNT